MTPTQGIEPTLRMLPPGFDSGILTLILVCFVINALLFPVLLRLWREFFKELGRSRRSILTTEHTGSERWVMASGLIQAVVFEAVALFCFSNPAPTSNAFASLAGVLLLVVLLLLFQISGYYLVGYAFAPKGETRSWIRALVLSQTISGYLMAVPALGALFYPEAEAAFLTAALTVYISCRILLYIKCFTIFYTSPASIFYFFLYLCTLEIVPLLAALAGATYFVQLFD